MSLNIFLNLSIKILVIKYKFYALFYVRLYIAYSVKYFFTQRK